MENEKIVLENIRFGNLYFAVASGLHRFANARYRQHSAAIYGGHVLIEF